MSGKIYRRMDTPEAREFWETVEYIVYRLHQRDSPGCDCASACRPARKRLDDQAPGRWRLLDLDDDGGE